MNENIFNKIITIMMIIVVGILCAGVGYGIYHQQQEQTIMESIQVEDVEMTEDGILITLKCNDRTDLYYYEDNNQKPNN